MAMIHEDCSGYCVISGAGAAAGAVGAAAAAAGAGWDARPPSECNPVYTRYSLLPAAGSSHAEHWPYLSIMR